MSTSLTDFSDVTSIPDSSMFDPTSYDAGLSDGVLDWSGSSGLPDVTAGSDTLTLSTGDYSNWDGSINDLNGDPYGNLSLSGVSDPFFGASAKASTPYPNQSQPSNGLNTMLLSLGKFGASIATMFAGQQRTTSAAATPLGTGTRAPSNPLQVNGSQTTILLIVIAAAVLLLMREEG